MIKTLVITPENPADSSLVLALEPEQGLRLEGVDCAPESVLQSLVRFAPEVILYEVKGEATASLALIRTILETHPVPIIVVSPDAKSSEESFKEAGAVAVLSFSKGTYSNILRHIRVMRGIRVVRPHPPKKLELSSARFLLVASSSGGPSVIRSLLLGLKPESGLSVVLAQHLSAENLSTFSDWLVKETPWKLRVCDLPTKPEVGFVYLGAGGSHIILKKGRLHSLPAESKLEFVPSADRLFSSFASSRASQVIAVVLSGMGNDGTQGMLKLRAAGAITLAQNPNDSKVSGMPTSAIEAGAVQRIVAEADLPSVVSRCVGGRKP